ncbi:MAG: vitamin K epoxide reductase family protein [Candidatus Micrarchaeota archaeon]
MRVYSNKYINTILFVLSAIGLIAAGIVFVDYYIEHSTSLPLCEVGENLGGTLQVSCSVISSSFSRVFGIPLDFLAIAWFGVNLILLAILVIMNRSKVMVLLLAWSILGVLVVPYLIYIELYVLHALCIYCTTMHIAIFLNFLIVLYLFLKS